MTKKDYTALVVLMDSSGSMFTIVEDMKGAVESLLEEQSKLPGKLTVDTVYFDAPSRATSWGYNSNITSPFVAAVQPTWYEERDTFAAAEDVKIDIHPRGGTALLDAIGRKVVSFGAALEALPEDERPDKVVFAIVTDGEENSSREYTYHAIQTLTKHQTEKYGWDFVYLGANQDAIAVARTIGIAAGSALTYDTKNVSMAGASMNSYVTGTRSFGSASFTDKDRKDNA